MKLDLMYAATGCHFTPVQLKAGWMLQHHPMEPCRVGVAKALHTDQQQAVYIGIDFTQSEDRRIVEAQLFITLHDRVLSVEEELFCVPVPVDVAAGMCLTFP